MAEFHTALETVPPPLTLIVAPLWRPVPLSVKVVVVFGVTDVGEIDVMFG
jgi:hypothetical protein